MVIAHYPQRSKGVIPANTNYTPQGISTGGISPADDIMGYEDLNEMGYQDDNEMGYEI